MRNLKGRRPAMHKGICQRMSPAELLEGENIPVVGQGVIIILKDAKRRPVHVKALKQTTLQDFNFKSSKKGFKQMLLTKYFKQG